MERLALFRPNFYLYIFCNCYLFDFSHCEKLLLYHDGVDAIIKSSKVNFIRVLKMLKRAGCSWFAHLGFKTRKDSFDCPCVRKRGRWEISAYKVDWNMQKKQNISFYIASGRINLQKSRLIHFVRSRYTLINKLVLV